MLDAFESAGLHPRHELVGPRYELFSMSLQAATVGLGVALVPEYDLDDELVCGRLIIPNSRSCPSDRGYYFAIPERKAEDPLLVALRNWLMEQVPRQA
jgi:DNA-binding transcriptional LysR family regulator